MYRYLSSNMTHIHKIDDLLKIMYICQMHRYLSRDLTQMQNERLCYLKIAILEKCQIHRYLSRDLTRIHKNKHYVSFA